MQHVTKLCADALRAHLKNPPFNYNLKSSHAHEIMAAFWGYKSKASMNADKQYPISNLTQADIIIVPPNNENVKAVFKQRQNELGISSYLFDEIDVYNIVSDTLKEHPIYFQPLEEVAQYFARERITNRFKPLNIDPDQLNLIFEITESNAKSSQISFTVSVDYISDNGSKTQHESTIVISFPRIAGYVGYRKPDIQESRDTKETYQVSINNKSQPEWPYPAGTLVMRRDTKEIGLVLSSTIGLKENEGTVSICTDTSLNALLSKEQVFPLSDQSREYIPLRLFIPYGKWICPDGSEVLYNRDYRPLWKKEIDGMVVPIDSTLFIEHDRDKTEGYFNWENTPNWGNPVTIREVGMSVLKDWGVENKKPQILDLLPSALAAGNADVFRQKY